jgi:hypothetical protein
VGTITLQPEIVKLNDQQWTPHAHVTEFIYAKDGKVGPEDHSKLDVIPINLKFCPVHGSHLIKCADGVHSNVLVEDVFPYQCIVGGHKWYPKLKKDMKPCGGIHPSNFLVCPSDDCLYCCCRECATGMVGGLRALAASKKYQIGRGGMLGVVGFLGIMLVQIIYLPIMSTAILILRCHPIYQCEFPNCYAKIETIFFVAVIYSAFTVLFLGLGLPLFFYREARGRKLAILESGALDYLWPEGERQTAVFTKIPSATWNKILALDGSMMKSLYEQFEFRFMVLQGTTLVMKFLIICPSAFAEPNSIVQLLGAVAVEVAQLAFVLVFSPFVDHWINLFGKIGSLCMICLLGFMCLHRVSLANDPEAAGYGREMIIVITFYALMFLFIIFKVVILPYIAMRLKNRQARKEAIEEAERQAAETDEARDDDIDMEG